MLSPPRQAGGEELAIFVFIDAFGWQIFQRHQEDFLQGILQTARPLDTVLGYSCACDPTILTGQLPQEHGHFSFFQYAPQRSPFRGLRPLGWLPRWLTSRGRVRRVISRQVARQLGYTGYFQLYNMPFHRLPLMDYSEKRDLYQPGGILSGAATIFDQLRSRRVPFHVSDWRHDEQRNFHSLREAIRDEQISWAYLYLAELDGILHRDGTRATTVTDHIRGYDRQLREILQLAGEHYRVVRMYLFSDHGMADVTGCYDLMADLQRWERATGMRFGQDYAAVFDSTMARFWLLSDRAEPAIRELLAGCPAGRTLSDAELNAYGCLFPQREYGDLFFLLAPGMLLCPSDMGSTPLKGMHGYCPSHEDSTAMVAATVPCLPPTRLDGLYSLMLRGVAGAGRPDRRDSGSRSDSGSGGSLA